MTGKKLAIVGGGVYVTQLCDVLAKTPGLPGLTICMAARRFARLHIIAEHCARRVKKVRPDWQVVACAALEEALAGADIVLLMIRAGGLAARAYDEEFPGRFGLVGDEGLGPGGFANAWRTLPVLSEIAREISRCAPGGRVLNLVAPLGMTTRLLLGDGIDTVGVCELPTVTRLRLLAASLDEQWSDSLDYAGLNHIGWFWAKDARGEVVLQQGARTGLVDPETLARSGAAPLHYYYQVFDTLAAERLGLGRQPGRAQELLALSELILQCFSTGSGGEVEELARRQTPWFDQAVAPIIAADLTGRPHTGFANVRNGGNLPWLPSDVVVEMAATFTGRELDLALPGQPPSPVMRFLQAAARAENLAFEACRTREPERMRSALRALPLPIPDAKLTELTQALMNGENIGG